MRVPLDWIRLAACAPAGDVACSGPGMSLKSLASPHVLALLADHAIARTGKGPRLDTKSHQEFRGEKLDI